MKKSNYIKEVEKRYGFKVKGLYTCEDRLENDNSYPDCLIFKWGVIPPNECTRRIVMGGVNSDLLGEINNSNDFYKLTNSGFNSFLHSSNKDLDKEEKKNLIPIVLIDISKSGHDYTLSFRIDNPMIREMFSDTKMISTNNEGSGYDEKELNHRFKEHKEYLDYFFIKKRGGDWIQTWFDKCGEDKKDLLHSEYLETKKMVS